MTNPLPPEHRPNRLRDDESIAILVALLAFGGIFAWAFGLTQNLNWLNAQNWLSGNLNTMSSMLQGGSGNQKGLSGAAGTGLATGLAGQTGSNTTNNLGLQGDSSQFSNPGEESSASGSPEATDEAGKTDAGKTATKPQDQATIGSKPNANPAAVGIVPNNGLNGMPTAPPSPNTLKEAVPNQAAPGKPIAFNDVPANHWASAFIAPLSAAGVIAGFQDGTFKPDEPITRSQFASYVAKTTPRSVKREFLVFKDVPKGSEQASLIEKAVTTGFMSGYSNGDFRPNQMITRMEAIIAAATGLDLPVPANPETILSLYEDRDQIPDWAKPKIAAATQAGLIANYPNLAQLRSDQLATRAEVATMFYQILVHKQQAEPIDSKYLVRSAQ